MGVKVERKKEQSLLLSALYRLLKLPLSEKTKLSLFLDLEWIFDRLAMETSFKYYSPETHPIRIDAKKFILNFVTGEHRVLDLGCKYGVISDFIAEKAKEVVGIDHDGGAIEIAKKNYRRNNLTFIQADAREFLQSNKEKFDVLILSHILEHLDEPKEFLEEFKKWFDYIYIEVPDFDRYHLNHYRKDLNLKLIYSDNDHVTEFDRYELKQLLDECNISILEAYYITGIQRVWCKT